MAIISLKAYISRVDTLLTVGNLDEVIHHCRHILLTWPRNAEVGHMLGQALIQPGGNSSEAQAVLRRVLAVTPDDAATHAALGEASRRNERFEEAIWYYERASEHATENRQYRERLRSLYRLQREPGTELPEGLPGAIARRQIRESQRVKAIRTLQQALQDEPGRQDLRILLARCQWDAEKRIEAAGTALDVLEALPWCLQANRILASLWLAESRPADARQFLERVHDVDPYLALRLAGGNPPEEHAFTLSELDYRQFGGNDTPGKLPTALPEPDRRAVPRERSEDDFQSDITDGSLPDWLQESVTSDGESDELAWLEGDAPAAAMAEAGESVLPWEGGAAPVPTSQRAPDEEGDELDWLNTPPAGEARWRENPATVGTGLAGPTGSDATVAQSAPPPGAAGNSWQAPPGRDPDATTGMHPRQQQFVFSRLPLWLRAPGAGLPALDQRRERRSRRQDAAIPEA